MSPKSILVTGCNRGIGLALVKQFAKLQSPPRHIFAGCRSPEQAQELNRLAKSNASLHVLQLDVTDQVSITKAKEVVETVVENGGLNLLINNAGIFRFDADIHNVTWEEMRRNFDVNAIGPLMISQTFLPLLKQAASQQMLGTMSCSKAAIINISSDYGSVTENTGLMYPYRASKAALNMITSCLSKDLKADDIFCAAIHPGWVETDMGGPDAEISVEKSVAAIFTILEKTIGTGRFREIV